MVIRLHAAATALTSTVKTEKMMSLDGISFHESSVVSFCSVGDEIRLELEEVLVSNNKTSVLLIMKSVREILVDHVQSKFVNMFFPDGEVLSLSRDGEELRLLVEWNHFEYKKSKTQFYQIACGDIELKMMK